MPAERAGTYVAMGSSFAAGPQLRPRSPQSPRPAGRSAVNYAHLLAERLHLELIDVSYSGATAAQLVDGAAGQPTQIDALTADTRLVTITGGGNDVGYIGRVTLASLPRPLRSLPRVRRRIAELGDATESSFAQLGATFDRLLAEVHRRAPQATVALVDYLTLLPPGDLAAPPLSPEIADWGRRVAERLAAETAAAAARAGCLLVAASTASRDHHAWSSDPWTTRFQFRLDRAPYHPNYAGMRAVADLLERTLK